MTVLVRLKREPDWSGSLELLCATAALPRIQLRYWVVDFQIR